MMKRSTVTATILALLVASFSLLAQEKMQEKKEMEKKDVMMKKEMKDSKSMGIAWKGYLVDKMCGSGYVKKDKETAMSKAMKHTTSCALEESCMESGYGLIIDGKYNKFDDAGDRMAVDYLKKTKSKDNLMVEVTGMESGEIVKVKSISEAKPEMIEKSYYSVMEKNEALFSLTTDGTQIHPVR